MKINEAAKFLACANKWRRGGEGEMPEPKQLGIAIDALASFVKALKVSDADPILGRRYQRASEPSFEVKVIGVCDGHVVYRRKGCGAALIGVKDFLKNFDLIDGGK